MKGRGGKAPFILDSHQEIVGLQFHAPAALTVGYVQDRAGLRVGPHVAQKNFWPCRNRNLSLTTRSQSLNRVSSSVSTTEVNRVSLSPSTWIFHRLAGSHGPVFPWGSTQRLLELQCYRMNKRICTWRVGRLHITYLESHFHDRNIKRPCVESVKKMHNLNATLTLHCIFRPPVIFSLFPYALRGCFLSRQGYIMCQY